MFFFYILNKDPPSFPPASLRPSSLLTSFLPFPPPCSPPSLLPYTFPPSTPSSPVLVNLVLTLPPAGRTEQMHRRCGLDVQEISGSEKRTVFVETCTAKTSFETRASHFLRDVPCVLHRPLLVTIVIKIPLAGHYSHSNAPCCHYSHCIAPCWSLYIHDITTCWPLYVHYIAPCCHYIVSTSPPAGHCRHSYRPLAVTVL